MNQETNLQKIANILHDFLKDCLHEPFDGDPIMRRARKEEYARLILSEVESEIKKKIADFLASNHE